jgi:hypothetical protein
MELIGFNPQKLLLWLLNQHELAINRGGQFAPVYPGQFRPVLGGQFQPGKVVSLLRPTLVNFTGISSYWT